MTDCKIVIIDDEYYFRQSVIKTLGELNLNCNLNVVGDACCGEDGIELIREHHPDIVMLDINMPIVDGLTVAKLIQTENICCKIIIISGYAEFDYAKRAIPLGVSHYLLKPLKRDELSAAVSEVIKQIEKQKEPDKNQSPTLTKSEYSPVTNRAICLIEESIHDSSLLVSLVAEQLHVNYSYLCTLFKKDTEISLNEYIVKRRIEKAKLMFDNGFYKINLVSKQLGYSDPSYFSKSFRQYTGLTPTEYIKSITD